jgi:hypothetical protein
MSRVVFRVFPVDRAGDTRVAICTISCFVSKFRVCACVCSFGVSALELHRRANTQNPATFFRLIRERADQLLSGRETQKSASPAH